MKPIKFKEANVTYAENQEEYEILPCWKSTDGVAVSYWKLTFFDRITALFTGKVWLSIHTHNQPLQPVQLGTTCPFEEN